MGKEMRDVNELILYRNFENGQILEDMEWVLAHVTAVVGEKDADASVQGEMKKRFFSCMHALIDLAGTYGFEGNLWHSYLTLILVNHENVFSTSCEIRGISMEAPPRKSSAAERSRDDENAAHCAADGGSRLKLARHDFAIFMELFALDFSGLEEKLGAGFFEEILHYNRGDVEGKVFNRRIRDRICELSAELACAAVGGSEAVKAVAGGAGIPVDG
ncbi:MAG: hypothetical protein LUF30_08535, partial [Lachnospiraceae bacterium]|nr:hypothetical protein [Lachnospiraceae bacterium]